MITLEQIFKPGGILESRLPSYEYRPSQQVMAEAVLEAIADRHPLCVEAGTGTGKTLAYLIPSLFCNQRVIVSTATKNLQDQIFFKDIPFIRQHLFPNLSVTYMKGRQNYLCLKKLHEQRPPEETHKVPEPWGSLSRWVQETETGDRSELSWMRDDDALWRNLDARSDTCSGQKCSYFDQCYVTRMRQRALEADLIVVNHALFFANLALEGDEIGRVLPSFSVLILDEAHEVEDIAAQHFGKQISNYRIEDLCRDFRKVFSDSSEFTRSLDQIQASSTAFFNSFPGFTGRYSLNFYQLPDGTEVDLRAEVLDSFQRLRQSLSGLYHSMEQQTDRPAETDPLIRRLEQMRVTLEAIFDLENSENVYWFENRARGVFLHVNPIEVAPILQQKLFSRTDTTIFTSATLTTHNNFEYFRERLGILEAKEVITTSEFDYLEQTMLYIPGSFPEPRSDRYLPRALHEIQEILGITRGHAFLLFTSFSQMNRVFEALREEIPFPLFRQGDLPKNQLLETFRDTPHAVLCATSSFWQGVDVQGDALRAVIIDKLPFLVPTEPLVAARINWLEKEGANSFLRYSVPKAIITLKQGLGRLIRSRRDRGILAVLDSRLRTRSYGQLFLESLPKCAITDNIDGLRDFFHQNASAIRGQYKQDPGVN